MSDETRVTEYQSENGSNVKLSPGIVRQYLVSGRGNVNDQEVMMFLMLCKQQKLDPFQKDAYLIKYGDNDPATIVVGKDTFMKRAESDPDFKGFEAGVIVDADGDIVERQGSFMRPDEGLPIGGWAKVYKEGRSVPYYASVSFEEYAGRKSGGDLNRQWSSKPATMIRKVALVQALREAFPKSFSGLYDAAEMAREEPAAAEPRDVSPPRKVDKVDNRGRKEKPAQPTEEELVALELDLNEALDRALEDGRITDEAYRDYQDDMAKHVKAGDASQYVSSVIARLPKAEAPESTEHKPGPEYKADSDEQPELIEDPPIF